MINDIKKTLWATADKLRSNMDAAEYKHLVLGLIFVKFVSDTFTARRDELARRFADPDDEYFLGETPDLETITALVSVISHEKVRAVAARGRNLGSQQRGRTVYGSLAKHHCRFR